MRLKDKVALVTGAGTGIGLAIARRFAEEGARVVVNDLKLATAQKAVSEIGDERALAVAADVSDSDQVKQMFQQVEREFGALDVLVNNAGILDTGAGEVERFVQVSEARLAEAGSGQGITTHWEMTRNLSDESWRRMMGVHLDGTFYCCREAIGLMAPREQGAIVNLSSVAGLSGIDAVPHYSAAKAGILGFTRALAAELGSQNIRVNAICPGYIETSMTSGVSEPLRHALSSQTPLLRWGRPDEIASVAAFLASDDASFCTGQWISPNGGIVMQ